MQITIIFGTNKTLEKLKFSETFHCDATYRLMLNRYPVFVCGVKNETGKFFLCFDVLSSHKDSTVQTINVIECSRWHCSQPCESRQVLQVYRIKNIRYGL